MGLPLVVHAAERLARRSADEAVQLSGFEPALLHELLVVPSRGRTCEESGFGEVPLECPGGCRGLIGRGHDPESGLSEPFGQTAGAGEQVDAGGCLARRAAPGEACPRLVGWRTGFGILRLRFGSSASTVWDVRASPGRESISLSENPVIGQPRSRVLDIVTDNGEVDRLRVCLSPRVSVLGSLHELIEEFGVNNGIPEGTIFLINLELDELLTNYVTHSLHKVSRPRMDVFLEVFTGRVVMTVLDTGPPFDPRTILPPDTGLSLEERQLGGLGLHFVRTYADDLAYECIDGCNQLRLGHNLQPLPAGAG